jgi:hypothetical protein
MWDEACEKREEGGEPARIGRERWRSACGISGGICNYRVGEQEEKKRKPGARGGWRKSFEGSVLCSQANLHSMRRVLVSEQRSVRSHAGS